MTRHGLEKTTKPCYLLCWTCFSKKDKVRQNYQRFCRRKVPSFADYATSCQLS